MLDFSHIPDNNKNTQIFTASNNGITGATTYLQAWTKPRGCSFVHIFGLGAGGGGGAGAPAGGLGLSAGGTGGASGAQFSMLFPASALPDIIYISVGAGGTAGNAASGGAGGDTRILMSPTIDTSVVQNSFAFAGGGGGGGVASGSIPGILSVVSTTNPTVAISALSGLSLISPIATLQYAGLIGQAGQQGTTAAALTAFALPTTGLMVTGGCGGAGISATGATTFQGGFITYPSPLLSASSDLNIGKPASSGIKQNTLMMFSGGHGGSSLSSLSTTCNGGDGSYGCGGGGGGGAFTGSTRTLGGKGGDGLVIITAW